MLGKSGKPVAWIQLSPKTLARYLKPHQEVFINLKGELFLRSYSSADRASYVQTLIRSDLDVKTLTGRKRLSAQSAQKVLEGLALANSKIWPMYLLYMLAGMGNLSPLVSNFAQGDFNLSFAEMFFLGTVSSITIGLFSLPVGVLQRRLSRRKTANIGLALVTASFLMPYLAGLDGSLGMPTDIKKYGLFAGLAFLGLGASFLDVALRPILLSVSKDGNYQRNVSDLSVFKQVFGNLLNNVFPWAVVSLAGAGLLPADSDWTAFFPVYGAATLAFWWVFNRFPMQRQTLESAHRPARTVKGQLGAFKEILRSDSPLGRLVRRGFLASVFYGAVMSISALYTQNLVREHYDGAGIWSLVAMAAFTAPVIVGRFFGGKLMHRGLRTPLGAFGPVSQGSMLVGSGWMAAAGLALLALPFWHAQVAGMLLLGLGLTNISTIVSAYTTAHAREVVDEVSSLLTFSSLFSALLVLSFGGLLDGLPVALKAAALLLPLGLVTYLLRFGQDVKRGVFKAEKPETPDPPETEEDKQSALPG